MRLFFRRCSVGALGFVSCLQSTQGSRLASSSSSTGLDESGDDDKLAEMLASNAPPEAFRNTSQSRPQDISTEAAGEPPRQAGCSGDTIENERTAAQSDSFQQSPGEHPAAAQRLLSDYQRWARVFIRTRAVENKLNPLGPSVIFEWLCVNCMKFNSEVDRRCLHCKADAWRSKKMQFPPVIHRPNIPDSWWCRACKVENTSQPGKELDPLLTRKHFTCRSCGNGTFSGLRSWNCTYCNLLNPKVAAKCESCGESRQATWTCQACLSKNCIFTSSCSDCSAVREVSEASVDHLAKCPSCGELNGAAWEVCFSCAAPFPNMAVVTRLIHEGGASKSNEKPSARKIPSAVPKLFVKGKASFGNAHRQNDAISLSGIKESTSVALDLKKWLCPICFRENSSREKECLGCSYIPVKSASTKVGQASVWNCQSCGGLNPTDVSICTICGDESPRRALSSAEEGKELKPVIKPLAEQKSKPKSAAVVTSSAAVETHQSPLKPGEWRCHACSSKNSPLTRRCIKCSASRVIAPGYWQCDKCFSVNKNSRDACVGCYTQRPQAQKKTQTTASNEVGWRCKHCSRMNKSTTFECYYCGIESDLVWSCPSCSLSNTSASIACVACGISKPIQDKWCCSVCREWCMDSICSRCTAPRSKSCEFIPSRWDCPTCKTRNQSVLGNCTSCKAPRILAKLSLTVSCESCHKMVDVGPSELCTNCQAPLSRIIGKLLSFSQPIASGRLRTTASAVDSVKKVDASTVLEQSGDGGAKQQKVSLVGTEPVSESDGCLDEDEVTSHKVHERAVVGASAGRDADEARKHGVDDDDDVLLQSFVSTDLSMGEGGEIVQDKFWTCSLCAAKNSEDVGECIVCGIRKGED
jgi:hypothetical protein